jgi:hypothetical protein
MAVFGGGVDCSDEPSAVGYPNRIKRTRKHLFYRSSRCCRTCRVKFSKDTNLPTDGCKQPLGDFFWAAYTFHAPQ